MYQTDWNEGISADRNDLFKNNCIVFERGCFRLISWLELIFVRPVALRVFRCTFHQMGLQYSLFLVLLRVVRIRRQAPELVISHKCKGNETFVGLVLKQGKSHLTRFGVSMVKYQTRPFICRFFVIQLLFYD